MLENSSERRYKSCSIKSSDSLVLLAKVKLTSTFNQSISIWTLLNHNYKLITKTIVKKFLTRWKISMTVSSLWGAKTKKEIYAASLQVTSEILPFKELSLPEAIIMPDLILFSSTMKISQRLYWRNCGLQSPITINCQLLMLEAHIYVSLLESRIKRGLIKE